MLCGGGYLRTCRVLAAPVALCLAFVVTGCGAATPAQLFSGAASSLDHLRTYRVSGGLYVGQDRVVMSADVMSDGDASGTIEVEDVSSNFIVAHGVSYFGTLSSAVAGAIDPSVEPILGRLHPLWWQAPGSTAARAALAVVDARHFAAEFLSGRAGAVETTSHDRRNHPAIALTNTAGTVFVSTASTPQVLEVTSAPHYISSSSFTNVDLIVDHLNERLNVQAPAGALPLENLDALPRYFTIKVAAPTDCDINGCTVSATVTSAVGHGTSMAHLNLVTGAGDKLATCSTPVSIAAVGESAPVSCRAASSAWTNFVYTGNPASTFGETGLVDPDPTYGPVPPS